MPSKLVDQPEPTEAQIAAHLDDARRIYCALGPRREDNERTIAANLARVRREGEAQGRHEDEKPTPKAGYDIGAGRVREGDTAMIGGRLCRVLTVYHDGDVTVEIPEVLTVKWREVMPAPQCALPDEPEAGRS